MPDISGGFSPEIQYQIENAYTTAPVTPTTLVKMHDISGGFSPEIQYQIESAYTTAPVTPTTTPVKMSEIENVRTMTSTATSTTTPTKMPEISCELSPEIQYEIENASTTTPVAPATTPTNMSETFDVLSPENQYKIENVYPATTRHAALRIYESLKRHWLRDEAGKAFGREAAEIEEVKGEEVDGDGKKNEELLGMEYILRDGFVSYLRDMARITPPVPQQVA